VNVANILEERLKRDFSPLINGDERGFKRNELEFFNFVLYL